MTVDPAILGKRSKLTIDPEPLVACVMLADGRAAMVQRAIQSFLRQSYRNKHLLILDSGSEPAVIVSQPNVVSQWLAPSNIKRSIGELRNLANALCLSHQIIAHWDSDDWSHPSRLEEQVAFLKASGAGVVAYNDMLFWRSALLHKGTVSGCEGCGSTPCICPGDAWLYRSPNPKQMVGTSLLYWRDVWNRVPFGPEHEGEDAVWVLKLASARVKTAACSSVSDGPRAGWPLSCRDSYGEAPRMIASIHGSNTSSQITQGVPEWRRAAGWDAFCRETMAL